MSLDGPPAGDPPRHRRESVGEQLEELFELAVEVELETGRPEETEQEAKRHIVRRVARVALGVVVLCAGILLVVLPGPGLLVMAVGLALMAPEVPFARRLLARVRERIPESEDGRVAVWVVVSSVAGLVASVGGSLWWTFGR